MDSSLSHTDNEANKSTDNISNKRGGWITFPFIAGAIVGLTLAAGGWSTNLIVYLIQEFNVKSIDAAQIYNVILGSVCFVPVIGAIIADSFIGLFSVILISSCISLLGIALLTLTAAVSSLRPQPCGIGSKLCQPNTKLQYAILYTSLTLASIGLGGTRFALTTMGANQFDKPKNQASYFNWFFVIFYFALLISSTVLVYVEDNVSWSLGFGLCAIANLVGLAIFLFGTRFYIFDKPQGSPFSGLARVIVATARKRNLQILSDESKDYFYGHGRVIDIGAAPPTKSLRFLNRAAQKTEEDIKSNGSIAKPWRLCTVQQVEDFKSLMRIFPLWSSTLFLITPIAIQSSMTVLQALTMDRHLGSHFKIPSSSTLVVVIVSTSIFLAIIDKFLCPMWEKLTGRFPTPLQRIGLGHVLNVLSMAVSALVETKRLQIAKDHDLQDQPGSVVPMLALWLFPQLVLAGVGEAFHFPGQVTLYYQEFPASLRSTSTAMISLIMGISFYLSTGIIDLVQSVTRWLPDNINQGKLENVYWMLVVVGVINFGYYLVCANLYTYQNVGATDDVTDDK